MDVVPIRICDAVAALPNAMKSRSGSIFYSGQSAFCGRRSLYILGLNPGGSPVTQARETIEHHWSSWLERRDAWSAYEDESWRGRPPGTHGMQPRMRHMASGLGIDLRKVPASNVVFVRSASEATLQKEKGVLLAVCWPVHAAVIEALGVDTVLCLGGTAGRWVRDALGANRLVGTFCETNNRGWTSFAHAASDGRTVITVTHPGRADWRNPAADPTPLVRSVIEASSGR